MTKSKLIKTRKPKFQLYTFNKFNFNITLLTILIYFINSKVLLIFSQNLQPKKYWKLSCTQEFIERELMSVIFLFWLERNINGYRMIVSCVKKL